MFSEWIVASNVALYFIHVRFQVLTAASMMFRIVFWDVLPCKIIVDRRFRGAYCLHHQVSSLPLAESTKVTKIYDLFNIKSI
jgi:hypothetical protein